MTDDLEESSLPGRPGFFVQTVMAGPLLMIVILLWFTNAAAFYDGGTTAVFFLVAGVFSTFATICAVSVAGLPLRLWARPRGWWVEHWRIPIAGMVLGLAVLVIGSIRSSYERALADDGYTTYYVDTVNVPLSVVGWLILAFCAMHAWWPERARGAGPAAPRDRRTAGRDRRGESLG